MIETIDKYMRSRVDIDDLAASVKYKRDFRKKNPTYFEPDGILVFCGPQGSGKTLSAVRYVLDLLRAFPNAILCSNVKIYGLPDSVRYVQYTGLDCFDKYNNGFEGVIFLIDEIHIEFNSLESKNMPVSICRPGFGKPGRCQLCRYSFFRLIRVGHCRFYYSDLSGSGFCR